MGASGERPREDWGGDALEFLIFSGRTLNNLAAESRKVLLSIGIVNLVAAPDRKDRRCLTVSSGT